MDSAGTLRAARTAAGLTQTELAARAGVTQSVISAYEAGHREPSLRTLRRLVRATGHRLDLSLRPTDPARDLPDTDAARNVRQHRQQIKRLAGARGAQHIRVFGSVARGDDTDESDIDLLVDVSNDVGLVGLASLERELSELLEVSVDVVPAALLKRGIRSAAEAEAIEL